MSLFDLIPMGYSYDYAISLMGTSGEDKKTLIIK